MDRPIKVAQIIGRTLNGGVENLILNYYLNIDRSRVQFDFFVESTSEIINQEKIEALGGKVIIIPSIKNIAQYRKQLKSKFLDGHYDIVQSNINTLSVFPLSVAKKCGVKIRIANSLSTSNRSEHLRNAIKTVLKPASKKFATHYFACSDLAGEWQFGKKICSSSKYYKVFNAVDLDRYKYSSSIREEFRNKYKLNDKFVVGTIGRLENQKNHLFLLDIFKEIYLLRKDSFLIIIGDGNKEQELKEKAKQLGIDEHVSILTSREVGVRGSASKFYSAFDCFVLPSLYEGLPTVGIEAQIASLPCFFASTITKETTISDRTFYLDIRQTPSEWAKEIVEKSQKFNRNDIILCEDYDIKVQGKKLTELYISLEDEK